MHKLPSNQICTKRLFAETIWFCVHAFATWKNSKWFDNGWINWNHQSTSIFSSTWDKMEFIASISDSQLLDFSMYGITSLSLNDSILFIVILLSVIENFFFYFVKMFGPRKSNFQFLFGEVLVLVICKSRLVLSFYLKIQCNDPSRFHIETIKVVFFFIYLDNVFFWLFTWLTLLRQVKKKCTYFGLEMFREMHSLR